MDHHKVTQPSDVLAVSSRPAVGRGPCQGHNQGPGGLEPEPCRQVLAGGVVYMEGLGLSGAPPCPHPTLGTWQRALCAAGPT